MTRQLHIIASTDPRSGGPVEVLLTSAAAMCRAGHCVEVASLDAPDAPWIKDLPLPIHALGPSTRRYSYSRRLVPWLRQHHDDYDVAVLHGLWNYASVGGRAGLRAGNVPYVVFAHGMLDPWFRSAYPLKHLIKQLYWTAFEGAVLRDAAVVLFTAEEERVLARSSFHGHAYREKVISLGTADVSGDAEAQIACFTAKYPALTHRRFILFLSRIHPKKGCDLLITAFASLASAHPDLDLVIAGPDQVGWKASLEQKANELGIESRIHWPGMLSGDTKWGAFRACEAFVLPSHQENFGIVVAEAMACGRPVLITNKVNIWREVEASGGGFVVDDNASDICRMLNRYFALDYADKQAMGERARAGFLKHFDVEMAARDLISVCEEAKERRGSA